jgi:SAM-dependent methyltransferase
MNPIGLLKRLTRRGKISRRFSPPKIENADQARVVRGALESFLAYDMKRFDALFLGGKPLAAETTERGWMEILASAGYVKKIIASTFRPCVRVFLLDGLFIATDLLTHEDEDQVFSLMLEQVVIVRWMDLRKGDHVLELCLGSGVNSIHAACHGAARVAGVDISMRALAFARANAAVNPPMHANSPRLEVFRGSLFEPIAAVDRFDLILVNPPFELVPPGEKYFLHSHGGEDGLDVVRALLPHVGERLKPGGRFEMFTWTPGSKDTERVTEIVAAALPKFRIEIRRVDGLPLEDRLANFRKAPGYAEWQDRLAAQGYTHVWGVHIRAVSAGTPGIFHIDAANEVNECNDVASEWF